MKAQEHITNLIVEAINNGAAETPQSLYDEIVGLMSETGKDLVISTKPIKAGKTKQGKHFLVFYNKEKVYPTSKYF